MTISEAITKIVSDVTKYLVQDFNPKIYVGKTNNVLRRANEHLEEGFSCTLRVAQGNPQLIAKLEKQLIFQLNKIKDCTLLNEKEASTGNSEADWLYISLSKCHPEDELCEYDEQQILGNEYPLKVE